MKKILVPTDYSEGAFHALKYAVELAEKYKSTIDVVNAYSMPPSGSTVMVDITEVLKKSADEAMEKLRKKVEDSSLHGKVEIRYSTTHGGVVQMIDHWNREKDIDMVVMGTQGASGITEKWLGTNASSAAKNVDKPLWAIPVDRDFSMPHKILFAIDMKVLADESPLHFVADLAKRFDSTVKFLHVRQSDKEYPDTDACKAQIREVFGDRKASFSFIHDDDIDEGIEETVKREHPDLLVVVRHEYGFFRNLFRSSVSRQVVNSAKLPILVLKS